ncbi:hypothetical protein CSU32_15190 [Salmonella enterica subsp. diarizonae]|nr:hypothetical protein [Salmonella enterica subsp. diarizonae]ECI3360051.1 hypothetical protein [Salmonella enterica subsp. diarizonae]
MMIMPDFKVALSRGSSLAYIAEKLDCESDIESIVTAINDLKSRVAELEPFRTAFAEWHDKTAWVQGDKRFDVLKPWGKHRADVLREYVEHQERRIAVTKNYLNSLSANDKCEDMSKMVSDMVNKKVSDVITQASTSMGEEALPDSDEKKPFANLNKSFEKVEVGKRLQENSVMLAAVLITILTEDVFEDVKKSSYLNYCRLARRALMSALDALPDDR